MTKVRAAVTECPGRMGVHELLTTEAGDADGPRAWRTEEVVSYAESFRQELQHFHECVMTRACTGDIGRGCVARYSAMPGGGGVASQPTPRDLPTAV